MESSNVEFQVLDVHCPPVETLILSFMQLVNLSVSKPKFKTGTLSFRFKVSKHLFPRVSDTSKKKVVSCSMTKIRESLVVIIFEVLDCHFKFKDDPEFMMMLSNPQLSQQLPLELSWIHLNCVLVVFALEGMLKV